MHVCSSCLRSLNNERVPAASLLCLDTGHVPPGLETPTLMELQLIAPRRVRRHVFVCRNATDWRPDDARTLCVRGHAVAFPNPPSERMAELFPCPLDQIPDSIAVVFLMRARSREEAEQIAMHTPAIKVRTSRHIASA